VSNLRVARQPSFAYLIAVRNRKVLALFLIFLCDRSLEIQCFLGYFQENVVVASVLRRGNAL